MNMGHEYNMDAAQRDLDRRAMEGEDMSLAFIDVQTYEIVKHQDLASYEATMAAWQQMIDERENEYLDGVYR
ncbi:hypothetical protein UFOVP1666_105 [uncultured Caudovirales phage]|uniref:Uncharacterized protein n=1 Tax=uncultured Caudovirales phage TaxID=2100421 RepID=A0A6J5Q6M9_9CAUD|nr:hypothetical protein UFOVP867_60 [uncultured Caudovirales phage]CAB4170901.1 hypothetical protein UFOVP913_138 [uncultured Caudovirales phage]CAB4177141.1 hypothetical protein UFOVP993_191 [uncultured Caudovirales phage]CAB4223062.1 hypothetical protein UFOVP1666_105 [uncultured Caudovirales phage]